MRQPGDPATWKRYRGTYDAIFEDGYLFEAVVEMDGDEALLDFITSNKKHAISDHFDSDFEH